MFFQENVVLSLILTFFLGASGGACVCGFGLFVDPLTPVVLLFISELTFLLKSSISPLLAIEPDSPSLGLYFFCSSDYVNS